MDIIIKSGYRIWKKRGFSVDKINKMMEEILKEHPHLCSSCSYPSCHKFRSYKSDIVVRSIRTLHRDYIFDCICYVPKQVTDEACEYNSNNSLVKYAEVVEHSVVDPGVKQIVRRMR